MTGPLKLSPPAALRIIETIADIPAAQWNALAGSNPFLSHAYLKEQIVLFTAIQRTLLVIGKPTVKQFYRLGEKIILARAHPRGGCTTRQNSGSDSGERARPATRCSPM